MLAEGQTLPCRDGKPQREQKRTAVSHWGHLNFMRRANVYSPPAFLMETAAKFSLPPFYSHGQ